MDSSSLITKELNKAEETLAKLQSKERKLLDKQQQQHSSGANFGVDDDGDDDESSSYNTLKQLVKLRGTVDSLALTQDYIEFLDRAATAVQESDDGIESNVLEQARVCVDLAQTVLLKNAEDVLELCPPLYEDAYLPLFHYVHEYLVTLLRQEIQTSRYPHPKGCAALFHQGSNGRLVRICQSLKQLETVHGQVLQAVEGAMDVPDSNTVLLELFHPLLDRVHFHFVDSGKLQHGNEKNEQGLLTAKRIDRLPEWLLKYIRDNFLGTNGLEGNSRNAKPFEVICMVDQLLAIPFAEELVRLIQWILVDQRSFFDDPAIVGSQSNPLFLYNAMEQFLEFDAALKATVSRRPWNANDDAVMSQQNNTGSVSASFMGLMDTLVVPNTELLDWWIKRERESVFSTLFPDDSDKKNDEVPKPLANHVSPRAEIFCALIRSVQYKAALLTAPGKYLREVAVPLCSQFVDALHETSVHLRNLMVQKQTQSMVLETQIVSNIHEWIEIINGTMLAARVLLTKERAWHCEGNKTGGSSESDHDLARFGRSLERLVEAMVEEFAATFVETILMERAKLASYLMMASHLIASKDWDADDMFDDLSVELKDTKIVLTYFQQVCNSILVVQDSNDNRSVSSENFAQDNIAFFAPSKMRAEVMNRVAEKFLEVALDINRVTPDIWTKGAAVFARDVHSVVGSFEDIATVSRLLEVTRLMTMDFVAVQGLFGALGGLVGSYAFLDVDEFTSDATLNEEAVQMLRAKNIHGSLEDAISILNRRRG